MGILDEYEVPVGMRPLVGYLANLKVEYPELYTEAVYDPDVIKPWVERWELFYNTNITTEYVKRRGWKLFHAVRELIQNSLDEQELVHGFAATFDVKIWLDDTGFHIRDYGRGVTLDAFRVGGTDKECWQRGYFGEGLKVAAGWFAMNGDLLYVIARGKIYKAVLFGDTVVIIIGKSTRHFEGTQATIYGPDVKDAERIVESVTYQTFVKSHRLRPAAGVDIKTKECPHYRRCFILENPTDYLWVGDIFVNYITKVANKKAAFSYNTWYVDLEPNRIMVTDIDRLKNIIAHIWRPLGDDKYDLLLEKILDDRGTVVIKVKDVFEVDALSGVSGVPYDVAADIRKKVAEAVKRRYGERVVTVDEEAKLDWFSYLLSGYIFIVTPTYEARSLFSEVKGAEVELLEAAMEREMQAEKSAIPYEALDFRSNIYVSEGNFLLYKLSQSLVREKPKYPVYICEKMLDASGMVEQGEKIYILKDKLFTRWEFIEVFVEEVSHLIGIMKYGRARDVSREFELAMRKVATEIYMLGIREKDKIESIHRGFYPVFSDRPFYHVDKILSSPDIRAAYLSLLRNEIKKLTEGLALDSSRLEKELNIISRYLDPPPLAFVSVFRWYTDTGDIYLMDYREFCSSDFSKIPVKDLQAVVNQAVYSKFTKLRDEYRPSGDMANIIVAIVWDFREYEPFVLTSEVVRE